MILPNDIIATNEARGQKLWLSQRMLLEICEDLTESYLWKKARPLYKKGLHTAQRSMTMLHDSGKAWRWGKREGEFYYDYDRIPDRKPSFYRSQLPTRSELLEAFNSNCQKQHDDFYESTKGKIAQLQLSYVDNSDLEFYKYQCDVKFSDEKASQLASAHAWLRMISELISDASFKRFGLKKKDEFYSICADILSVLKLEGLGVKNGETLRKKVAKLPMDVTLQRYYLVSKKYGNENKKIFGAIDVVDIETGEIKSLDMHEAITYNLWMNPGKANKITVESVYSKYVVQCEDFGIDPVTKRTIRDHISRFSNKAKMSLERDGSDHFTSAYMPYIPQVKPKYSSTLWCADFSGSKLLFRYYKDGWKDKRKVRKLKTGSWYVLRIVDTCTDYVVGWHCVPSNTAESWVNIAPAINMALENNDGYLAHEIVTDNGPGFSSKEGAFKLDLLFDRHRRTALGNKQANKAEMYVRLMSAPAREFDNWAKSSFAATHISNQANPDYMNNDDLPWEAEAYAQIEESIELWNNSPRPDGTIPAEEFKKRRNTDLKPVDERSLRYAFGYSTEKTLRDCRGQLVLSKKEDGLEQLYCYSFDDWMTDAEKIDNALYGSTNMKVKIAYDSKGADIYTPDNVYILSVKPNTKSHASIYESSDQSIEAFERGMASKATAKNKAVDFAQQAIDSLNTAINNTPEEEEDEFEDSTSELTYLQRAALNGGKAKEEHNKLQNDKLNINDDDDMDDLLEDSYMNEL